MAEPRRHDHGRPRDHRRPRRRGVDQQRRGRHRRRRRRDAPARRSGRVPEPPRARRLGQSARRPHARHLPPRAAGRRLRHRGPRHGAGRPGDRSARRSDQRDRPRVDGRRQRLHRRHGRTRSRAQPDRRDVDPAGVVRERVDADRLQGAGHQLARPRLHALAEQRRLRALHDVGRHRAVHRQFADGIGEGRRVDPRGGRRRSRHGRDAAVPERPARRFGRRQHRGRRDEQPVAAHRRHPGIVDELRQFRRPDRRRAALEHRAFGGGHPRPDGGRSSGGHRRARRRLAVRRGIGHCGRRECRAAGRRILPRRHRAGAGTGPRRRVRRRR